MSCTTPCLKSGCIRPTLSSSFSHRSEIRRFKPHRVSLQTLDNMAKLLPFLVRRDHLVASLDHWASKYVRWCRVHGSVRVSQLPGYDVTVIGDMWRLSDFVHEDSFRMFVVFGSSVEMPFSVYFGLSSPDDGTHFVHDMCLRRRLRKIDRQSQIVEEPLDQWAVKFVDWLDPWYSTMVQKLPRWPEGWRWHANDSLVRLDALKWFVVFAEEEMPFSIFSSLCSQGEYLIDQFRTALRERRDVQGSAAHQEELKVQACGT